MAQGIQYSTVCCSVLYRTYCLAVGGNLNAGPGNGDGALGCFCFGRSRPTVALRNPPRVDHLWAASLAGRPGAIFFLLMTPL